MAQQDVPPIDAAPPESEDAADVAPVRVKKRLTCTLERRICRVNGADVVLHALGVPVKHRQPEKGPLGDPQAVRVSHEIFLCVECLMTMEHADVFFAADGTLAEPVHKKGKGVHPPFVFCSGGSLSPFHRHRQRHRFKAFARSATARSAKRRAGPGNFMGASESTGDEYELAHAIFLCCVMKSSFSEAAGCVVLARQGMRSDLRGKRAIATLRKATSLFLPRLRDYVLGALAVDVLTQSVGRLALTMDGWTSPHNGVKHTAVTIHFGDSFRTEVRSCCIAVMPVADGSAREALCAAKKVFRRFIQSGRESLRREASRPKRPRRSDVRFDDVDHDITRMASAIVVDNAASAKRGAQMILDEKRHVPCAAHTLELVLFDVCESLSQKARDLWSRDAGEAYHLLRHCVSSARHVAAHFRRSAGDWRVLQEMQPAHAGRERASLPKPKPHVATRWGSTSVCMASVVKVLPALVLWAEQGNSEHSVVDDIGLLNKNHVFFDDVTTILERFRCQRDRLCREFEVTLSQVLVVLKELYNLVDVRLAGDHGVGLVKSALHESLASRFGCQVEANLMEMPQQRVGQSSSDYGKALRKHNELKTLVAQTGNVHDAAFAASALDPRTMHIFPPGMARDEATDRAARFLAHLAQVFHGEPAVLNLDAASVDVMEDFSGSSASESDDSAEAAMKADESHAAGANAAVRDKGAWRDGLKGTRYAAYKFIKARFRVWVEDQRAQARRVFAQDAPGLQGDGEEPARANLRPLNMPVAEVQEFNNPIKFWHEHNTQDAFKEMFEMAMAVLCIPATEAASERTFRHAKYVHAAERTRMTNEVAEAQVICGRGLGSLGVTDIRAMCRFIRTYRASTSS